MGLLYVWLVSPILLPEQRTDRGESTSPTEFGLGLKRIEVVLGARFPAINRKVIDFDFKRKYGADILELKRNGETMIMHDMRRERFHEGDTLVLLANDDFMKNWGDSSFFLMVTDGNEQTSRMPKWKRWFSIVLLVLMIIGATVGELPAVREAAPNMHLDMFSSSAW